MFFCFSVFSMLDENMVQDTKSEAEDEQVRSCIGCARNANVEIGLRMGV